MQGLIRAMSQLKGSGVRLNDYSFFKMEVKESFF